MGQAIAYMPSAGDGAFCWRHVVPNALVPTVNLLAVNIGWLIGGTVVVESVFAVPGLGQLVEGRDERLRHEATAEAAEVAVGVGIGGVVVRSEGRVHLVSGATDGIKERRDEEGVL